MVARRVLLTGGAGAIGTVVRAGLRDVVESLRIYDRRTPRSTGPDEQWVCGDLADQASLQEACRGIDVVAHLAGLAVEGDFETIAADNIRGTYNLFESARREGVSRVIFASSNHVTGYYSVADVVDASSAVRPDTLYGVSKVFGEALGRMYHDKWGMEVVCLRIGSFRSEPEDERQLSTWLSHQDAVELFRRCVTVDDLPFLVGYAVSANTRSWWHDDSLRTHLGFQAQDDAEVFADRLAAPGTAHIVGLQGGSYATPTASTEGGPSGRPADHVRRE